MLTHAGELIDQITHIYLRRWNSVVAGDRSIHLIRVSLPAQNVNLIVTSDEYIYFSCHAKFDLIQCTLNFFHVSNEIEV